MISNGESQKHKTLVAELVKVFTTDGFDITGVDLEGWDNKPAIVENGGNESKQPDIDAFDSVEQVYIRGEAKVGDGDIETEHSINQYVLFSNKINQKNNKSSLLYIIVPKSKIQLLNDIIVKNVPQKNWGNIRLIKSSTYEY